MFSLLVPYPTYIFCCIFNFFIDLLDPLESLCIATKFTESSKFEKFNLSDLSCYKGNTFIERLSNIRETNQLVRNAVGPVKVWEIFDDYGKKMLRFVPLTPVEEQVDMENFLKNYFSDFILKVLQLPNIGEKHNSYEVKSFENFFDGVLGIVDNKIKYTLQSNNLEIYLTQAKLLEDIENSNNKVINSFIKQHILRCEFFESERQDLFSMELTRFLEFSDLSWFSRIWSSLSFSTVVNNYTVIFIQKIIAVPILRYFILFYGFDFLFLVFLICSFFFLLYSAFNFLIFLVGYYNKKFEKREQIERVTEERRRYLTGLRKKKKRNWKQHSSNAAVRQRYFDIVASKSLTMDVAIKKAFVVSHKSESVKYAPKVFYGKVVFRVCLVLVLLYFFFLFFFQKVVHILHFTDEFYWVLKFFFVFCFYFVFISFRTYSYTFIRRFESLFVFFFIFSVCCVLIFFNGFFEIYLGLELISFCIYSLLLFLKNPENSFATMKYFIISGLAGYLFLLGFSLFSGSLSEISVTDLCSKLGFCQTFLDFLPEYLQTSMFSDLVLSHRHQLLLTTVFEGSVMNLLEFYDKMPYMYTLLRMHAQELHNCVSFVDENTSGQILFNSENFISAGNRALRLFLNFHQDLFLVDDIYKMEIIKKLLHDQYFEFLAAKFDMYVTGIAEREELLYKKELLNPKYYDVYVKVLTSFFLKSFLSTLYDVFSDNPVSRYLLAEGSYFRWFFIDKVVPQFLGYIPTGLIYKLTHPFDVLMDFLHGFSAKSARHVVYFSRQYCVTKMSLAETFILNNWVKLSIFSNFLVDVDQYILSDSSRDFILPNKIKVSKAAFFAKFYIVLTNYLQSFSLRYITDVNCPAAVQINFSGLDEDKERGRAAREACSKIVPIETSILQVFSKEELPPRILSILPNGVVSKYHSYYQGEDILGNTSHLGGDTRIIFTKEKIMNYVKKYDSYNPFLRDDFESTLRLTLQRALVGSGQSQKGGQDLNIILLDILLQYFPSNLLPLLSTVNRINFRDLNFCRNHFGQVEDFYLGYRGTLLYKREHYLALMTATFDLLDIEFLASLGYFPDRLDYSDFTSSLFECYLRELRNIERYYSYLFRYVVHKKEYAFFYSMGSLKGNFLHFCYLLYNDPIFLFTNRFYSDPVAGESQNNYTFSSFFFHYGLFGVTHFLRHFPVPFVLYDLVGSAMVEIIYLLRDDLLVCSVLNFLSICPFDVFFFDLFTFGRVFGRFFSDTLFSVKSSMFLVPGLWTNSIDIFKLNYSTYLSYCSLDNPKAVKVNNVLTKMWFETYEKEYQKFELFQSSDAGGLSIKDFFNKINLITLNEYMKLTDSVCGLPCCSCSGLFTNFAYGTAASWFLLHPSVGLSFYFQLISQYFTLFKLIRDVGCFFSGENVNFSVSENRKRFGELESFLFHGLYHNYSTYALTPVFYLWKPGLKNSNYLRYVYNFNFTIIKFIDVNNIPFFMQNRKKFQFSDYANILNFLPYSFQEHIFELSMTLFFYSLKTWQLQDLYLSGYSSLLSRSIICFNLNLFFSKPVNFFEKYLTQYTIRSSYNDIICPRYLVSTYLSSLTFRSLREHFYLLKFQQEYLFLLNRVKVLAEEDPRCFFHFVEDLVSFAEAVEVQRATVISVFNDFSQYYRTLFQGVHGNNYFLEYFDLVCRAKAIFFGSYSCGFVPFRKPAFILRAYTSLDHSRSLGFGEELRCGLQFSRPGTSFLLCGISDLLNSLRVTNCYLPIDFIVDKFYFIYMFSSIVDNFAFLFFNAEEHSLKFNFFTQLRNARGAYGASLSCRYSEVPADMPVVRMASFRLILDRVSVWAESLTESNDFFLKFVAEVIKLHNETVGLFGFAAKTIFINTIRDSSCLFLPFMDSSVSFKSFYICFTSAFDVGLFSILKGYSSSSISPYSLNKSRGLFFIDLDMQYFSKFNQFFFKFVSLRLSDHYLLNLDIFYFRLIKELELFSWKINFGVAENSGEVFHISLRVFRENLVRNMVPFSYYYSNLQSSENVILKSYRFVNEFINGINKFGSPYTSHKFSSSVNKVLGVDTYDSIDTAFYEETFRDASKKFPFYMTAYNSGAENLLSGENTSGAPALGLQIPNNMIYASEHRKKYQVRTVYEACRTIFSLDDEVLVDAPRNYDEFGPDKLSFKNSRPYRVPAFWSNFFLGGSGSKDVRARYGFFPKRDGSVAYLNMYHKDFNTGYHLLNYKNRQKSSSTGLFLGDTRSFPANLFKRKSTIYVTGDLPLNIFLYNEISKAIFKYSDARIPLSNNLTWVFPERPYTYEDLVKEKNYISCSRQVYDRIPPEYQEYEGLDYLYTPYMSWRMEVRKAIEQELALNDFGSRIRVRILQNELKKEEMKREKYFKKINVRGKLGTLLNYLTGNPDYVPVEYDPEEHRILSARDPSYYSLFALDDNLICNKEGDPHEGIYYLNSADYNLKNFGGSQFAGFLHGYLGKFSEFLESGSIGAGINENGEGLFVSEVISPFSGFFCQTFRDALFTHKNGRMIEKSVYLAYLAAKNKRDPFMEKVFLDNYLNCVFKEKAVFYRFPVFTTSFYEFLIRKVVDKKTSANFPTQFHFDLYGQHDNFIHFRGTSCLNAEFIGGLPGGLTSFFFRDFKLDGIVYRDFITKNNSSVLKKSNYFIGLNNFYSVFGYFNYSIFLQFNCILLVITRTFFETYCKGLELNLGNELGHIYVNADNSLNAYLKGLTLSGEFSNNLNFFVFYFFSYLKFCLILYNVYFGFYCLYLKLLLICYANYNSGNSLGVLDIRLSLTSDEVALLDLLFLEFGKGSSSVKNSKILLQLICYNWKDFESLIGKFFFCESTDIFFRLLKIKLGHILINLFLNLLQNPLTVFDWVRFQFYSINIETSFVVYFSVETFFDFFKSFLFCSNMLSTVYFKAKDSCPGAFYSLKRSSIVYFVLLGTPNNYFESFSYKFLVLDLLKVYYRGTFWSFFDKLVINSFFNLFVERVGLVFDSTTQRFTSMAYYYYYLARIFGVTYLTAGNTDNNEFFRTFNFFSNLWEYSRQVDCQNVPGNVPKSMLGLLGSIKITKTNTPLSFFLKSTYTDLQVESVETNKYFFYYLWSLVQFLFSRYCVDVVFNRDFSELLKYCVIDLSRVSSYDLTMKLFPTETSKIRCIKLSSGRSFLFSFEPKNLVFDELWFISCGFDATEIHELKIALLYDDSWFFQLFPDYLFLPQVIRDNKIIFFVQFLFVLNQLFIYFYNIQPYVEISYDLYVLFLRHSLEHLRCFGEFLSACTFFFYSCMNALVLQFWFFNFREVLGLEICYFSSIYICWNVLVGGFSFVYFFIFLEQGYFCIIENAFGLFWFSTDCCEFSECLVFYKTFAVILEGCFLLECMITFLINKSTLRDLRVLALFDFVVFSISASLLEKYFSNFGRILLTKERLDTYNTINEKEGAGILSELLCSLATATQSYFSYPISYLTPGYALFFSLKVEGQCLSKFCFVPCSAYLLSLRCWPCCDFGGSSNAFSKSVLLDSEIFITQFIGFDVVGMVFVKKPAYMYGKFELFIVDFFMNWKQKDSLYPIIHRKYGFFRPELPFYLYPGYFSYFLFFFLDYLDPEDPVSKTLVQFSDKYLIAIIEDPTIDLKADDLYGEILDEFEWALAKNFASFRYPLRFSHDLEVRRAEGSGMVERQKNSFSDKNKKRFFGLGQREHKRLSAHRPPVSLGRVYDGSLYKEFEILAERLKARRSRVHDLCWLDARAKGLRFLFYRYYDSYFKKTYFSDCYEKDYLVSRWESAKRQYANLFDEFSESVSAPGVAPIKLISDSNPNLQLHNFFPKENLALSTEFQVLLTSYEFLMFPTLLCTLNVLLVFCALYFNVGLRFDYSNCFYQIPFHSDYGLSLILGKLIIFSKFSDFTVDNYNLLYPTTFKTFANDFVMLLAYFVKPYQIYEPVVSTRCFTNFYYYFSENFITKLGHLPVMDTSALTELRVSYLHDRELAFQFFLLKLKNRVDQNHLKFSSSFRIPPLVYYTQAPFQDPFCFPMLFDRAKGHSSLSRMIKNILNNVEISPAHFPFFYPFLISEKTLSFNLEGTLAFPFLNKLVVGNFFYNKNFFNILVNENAGVRTFFSVLRDSYWISRERLGVFFFNDFLSYLIRTPFIVPLDYILYVESCKLVGAKPFYRFDLEQGVERSDSEIVPILIGALQSILVDGEKSQIREGSVNKSSLLSKMRIKNLVSVSHKSDWLAGEDVNIKRFYEKHPSIVRRPLSYSFLAHVTKHFFPHFSFGQVIERNVFPKKFNVKQESFLDLLVNFNHGGKKGVVVDGHTKYFETRYRPMRFLFKDSRLLHSFAHGDFVSMRSLEFFFRIKKGGGGSSAYRHYPGRVHQDLNRMEKQYLVSRGFEARRRSIRMEHSFYFILKDWLSYYNTVLCTPIFFFSWGTPYHRSYKLTLYDYINLMPSVKYQRCGCPMNLYIYAILASDRLILEDDERFHLYLNYYDLSKKNKFCRRFQEQVAFNKLWDELLLINKLIYCLVTKNIVVRLYWCFYPCGFIPEILNFGVSPLMQGVSRGFDANSLLLCSLASFDTLLFLEKFSKIIYVLGCFKKFNWSFELGFWCNVMVYKSFFFRDLGHVYLEKLIRNVCNEVLLPELCITPQRALSSFQRFLTLRTNVSFYAYTFSDFRLAISLFQGFAVYYYYSRFSNFYLMGSTSFFVNNLCIIYWIRFCCPCYCCRFNNLDFKRSFLNYFFSWSRGEYSLFFQNEFCFAIISYYYYKDRYYTRNVISRFFYSGFLLFNNATLQDYFVEYQTIKFKKKNCLLFSQILDNVFFVNIGDNKGLDIFLKQRLFPRFFSLNIMGLRVPLLCCRVYNSSLSKLFNNFFFFSSNFNSLILREYLGNYDYSVLYPNISTNKDEVAGYLGKTK